MFPAKKYYIFTNIPGSSESPKMKILPNFQKHSHQSPFFDKFSNLTAPNFFFTFFLKDHVMALCAMGPGSFTCGRASYFF